MKISSITINNDGMTKAQAGDLWSDIEGFASYSFNASHSVAYSVVGFQAMYLKMHYPVEFYAAALSTVGEKKLQVIVNDAAAHGIKIMPPDINISTDEFVIGNDNTLYMPFNRIHGVSDKGALEIVKGRKKASYTRVERVAAHAGETTAAGKPKLTFTDKEVVVPCEKGRFTSMEDFAARTETRLVNSRVVEHLDIVGAFSRVVKGQPEATDVSRRKQQMVLLPGLMTGVIVADRIIPTDIDTQKKLRVLFEEFEAITNKTEFGETEILHARPAIATTSKFMAVMDAPGHSEEAQRMMSRGESFAFTAEALLRADLKKTDGYWTSLIKKRKTGKILPPEDIKTYAPFLTREVEILRPPLIVTLGSAAARFFVPELKGAMDDHIGRTFYNEKLDAMILIGFNPQMCYFDINKMDDLVAIFEVARTIITP